MSKTPRSAAVVAFENEVLKSHADVVEQFKHFLDSDKAPAITNPVDRWAMARMLATADKVLKTQEATQTTTVFGNNYRRALMGMTRQVFPRLIGTDLVATQPVDQPTGQVFHLTLKRDDNGSLGIRPSGDASGIGFTAMQAQANYSDSPGEGAAITTGMKIEITSSPVDVGKAKKLNVGASLELTQDLTAYHNLDAMELLRGAATDQIAAEIDAQMVAAVRNAAIANVTFNFGSPATGWTAKDWAVRIQYAILKANQRIFLKSRRNANRIVCGSEAFLMLQDLNTFKIDASMGAEEGNYGLVPVGTLNGSIRVYQSNSIPANEILLTRKGEGFLDAGVVYAPYVPLFVSEKQFDNRTQTYSQSFASRYDILTVSNTLSARVTIDDSTEGITEVV